jgi:polysaccharide biosynthesis/export protein
MTNFLSLSPYSKTLVYLIALVSLLSSCRSYKDLTMLRDGEDNAALLPRTIIEDQYVIRVNDNLYVSIVSTNPELDIIYNPATIGNAGSGVNSNVWAGLPSQYIHGYLVDIDGSVTLPSFGRISVLGLSISEAEAAIQAKANEYLKNVTAKVRLLNFKITVMGEVVSPGVYFNYNPEITVFDAISMASGIKNTAALNNVLVVREVGNETRIVKLDLNKINSLTSEGYVILPNDVVIVQPAKFKDLELRLPVYSIVLSTITTFLLVLNYVQGTN